MPDEPTTDTLAPYDGVILLSFGGPEGPDDVMPFLENVTAGRGIPRERLLAVAEHYHHFGGRSPINDQNRALLAALRTELDGRGLGHVPLSWGNRNWEPYVTDAVRDAHAAGARRLLAVPTSAYSSYSGCRQYREDMAAAVLAMAGEDRSVTIDKIRHYHNAPGFVAANADAVAAALGQVPGDLREGARVLFVTHSIPETMDAGSGPEGHRYTAQHLDTAAAVAAAVTAGRGAPVEWDLVYCSRSGPPTQPWLEPDVNDRLSELAARGTRAVVVAPIGFVSDHMEVRFDLDTEAAATAADLGLAMVRAATVGTDPRFVAALADLCLERAAQARGEPVRPSTAGERGPSWAVCPAGCCPGPRAARPAAGGADWVPPEVPPQVATSGATPR